MISYARPYLSIFRALAVSAILGLMISLFAPAHVNAQNRTLAIIDSYESQFIRRFFFGDYRLKLRTDANLSYKIRYLNDPYRIVFDFEDTSFDTNVPSPQAEGESAPQNPLTQKLRGVARIAYGRATETSSRLVIGFDSPVVVTKATYEIDNDMRYLALDLEHVSDEDFAEKIDKFAFRETVFDEINATRPISGDPDLPLIVIDPGHGGIDSGATRDGVFEKDITLSLGLELADILAASGRYRVAMTRDKDVFVGLRARRDYAQKVDGDLLLSLHANTVEEGDASGTTVYVLSDEASSRGAAHYAAFENRSDHFAGLPAQDVEEDISRVLIDLARAGTDARSSEVARRLQNAFSSLTLRPDWSRRESAAFAVLKAPDVPSVLIEIGFLSNDRDRQMMLDPNWRKVLIGQFLIAIDGIF